ncbi:hypothetical protein C0995_002975, partial [Termitomyces sp. Mi166
ATEHAITTSKAAPVQGNAGSLYLTMHSRNGLIFGVINIIGNFATVFNDQAYWQRTIASQPASCIKAYLLNRLAWFSIPFTFATTISLAAVVLRDDPNMHVLTPANVSAGLPTPAAVTALLDQGGASTMLVLLFLAVTSATSAELIAVSSILTYDVYKTFIGVVLGSAIVPTTLCVLWSKANKWGCIVGAIGGFFASLIAWLVITASLNGGAINVMYPANFNFAIIHTINMQCHHNRASNHIEVKEEDDKKFPSVKVESISNVSGLTEDRDLDPVGLNRAFKFAA